MEKLVDKFEIYDLLGTILPGFLMLGWISICFPTLNQVNMLPLPEGVSIMALLALVFALGNLIQALASLLQPLLYKTLGGKPSDTMLAGKNEKYLSKTTAERVSQKLRGIVGENATPGACFEVAMAKAPALNERVAKFNALYGYHRNLLTTVILAMALGAISVWKVGTTSLTWGADLALLPFAILIWFRTKQWGLYYAREVLMTFDRSEK